MNEVNNVTFTGVKYTSAGKQFASMQSQKVRETLQKAEQKMKRYRYANLIVNSNGYAVQYADNTGKHSCKINQILHSLDNDVTYKVNSKNTDRFVFSFYENNKGAYDCAIDAANDATDKNSWLNSSIRLVKLLEKQGGQPVNKNWMDKLKAMLTF